MGGAVIVVAIVGAGVGYGVVGVLFLLQIWWVIVVFVRGKVLLVVDGV